MSKIRLQNGKLVSAGTAGTTPYTTVKKTVHGKEVEVKVYDAAEYERDIDRPAYASDLYIDEILKLVVSSGLGEE